MNGIGIYGGYPELVISPESEFWNLSEQDQLDYLSQFKSELDETHRSLKNPVPPPLSINPQKWTGIRQEVYQRDGSNCRYCGQDFQGDETIDHIIPKIQGGKEKLENMVMACRSCNSRKNGRTPEQAGMRLLP